MKHFFPSNRLIVSEKINVNFTQDYSIKAQGGSYSFTLPLTSVPDGGGWSTPRPAPLHREISGTGCTGGWVGPRVGLNTLKLL